MFKTILYPTDFSDVAGKSLDYIKQLRAGGAERVILLHVIDRRGMEALERYSAAHSVELEQKIIAETQEELQAIADNLQQAGFETETRVVVGIPVRRILAVEEKEDVSLLVLGSHGKSNMEEIFLGSVSEKVVRKCTKPVLVVKR